MKDWIPYCPCVSVTGREIWFGRSIKSPSVWRFVDVTHGLGDFLTLPPGLSQFQAPYTLLSSFLCSCLCTCLGSPNRFLPVVKMNPPIGGFQNQHHPPCSVLHCWSRWHRGHSLHLQAPPRFAALFSTLVPSPDSRGAQWTLLIPTVWPLLFTAFLLCDYDEVYLHVCHFVLHFLCTLSLLLDSVQLFLCLCLLV